MRQLPTLLMAVAIPALLVACGPGPGPSPVDPVPETSANLPPVPPFTQAPAQPDAQPDPLELTGFEPATVEIYCSFFRVTADGEWGDRVFMTEIAGNPAPAAIGLEGQPVALTRLSKEAGTPVETWTYGNAERGVEVELQLTETEEGFEHRDYEGTLRITRPEARDPVAISGSCGV